MASNIASVLFVRGSSQAGTRTDTASLSQTGDVTLETWVKLTQLPSSVSAHMVLGGKYNTTGNKRAYEFILRSDDKVRFYYSGDGTNTTILEADTSIVSGDVGVWTHLAVAVDVSGKTGTFYKNGLPDGVTLISGTQTAIIDNDADFNIGRTASPDLYLDGRINNFRLWGDRRSDAEILANYKKVLTNPGTDNLIDSWYYKGDHTSASGNNDLTGVNTPTFSGDIPFGTAGGSPMFFSTGGVVIT